MHTVGQKLQQTLDDNGISQALLAYRTGLTPKHVNFLVKDKAKLSVEVAVIIEHAFPKVRAFPLLMLQVRQDIAKMKHKRALALHGRNSNKEDANAQQGQRLPEAEGQQREGHVHQQHQQQGGDAKDQGDRDEHTDRREDSFHHGDS